MRKIAVCICTYDRPRGLEALLAAVDNQRLRGLEDSELHIIVVDNSAAASAEASYEEYAREGRFKSSFVHEPQKGLAVARNTGLAAARDKAASHLVFIDDDEVPEPAWLDELVGALDRTGAAAAVGPVFPVFEVPPGPLLPPAAYVKGWLPKTEFMSDGYTSNAIIRMQVIDAHGLAFDHRFNETGGEDTLFFKRLLDCGEKIALAGGAIVHESIPRPRMSPGWLWRRWYRTGAIEANLGRYDAGSLRGRTRSLAAGVARLAAGSLRIAVTALLMGWRKPDAVVASFYTLCRGAGLVAAAFDVSFKEYAHRTYR